MTRYLKPAFFALSLATLGSPTGSAFANEHDKAACSCDQACTDKCAEGSNKDCNCSDKDCNCKEGDCKHGKCKHEAKGEKPASKAKAKKAK
jgi:hypothetical protein